MSAPDPTAVAPFRYTVIAPLVTRTLTYGEQRALLRDLVARPWTDPTGRARFLHVRTVERWVAAYRAGGWDALRPVPRRDHGTVRALTPDVLARAFQLRAEEPHRSVRQVMRLLEVAGVVAPGHVGYSTLTRHFRAQGWESPAGPRSADTFRRRQAPYANAEWQADTQLTLKLPDPQHPDRPRQVYLVAVIDDATRYLVGAQFFFQENRPRLEEVLKGAVVRYGVPEIVHCDNGAIYASAYLTRVCAELRIDLRHSAVRRPEGKAWAPYYTSFVVLMAVRRGAVFHWLFGGNGPWGSNIQCPRSSPGTAGTHPRRCQSSRVSRQMPRRAAISVAGR